MLNIPFRRAGRMAIATACMLSVCWFGRIAVAQEQQGQPAPVIKKTVIINPDGTTSIVAGDATGIKAPATNPAPDATPTTRPAVADAAPTTNPSGPAFHVGLVPAKVTPEAQHELDQVKQAYSTLAAMDMSGTVSGTFDVAGKKTAPSMTFSASYQSPNKFRMEVKDDMVVGATGEKVFALKSDENEYLLLDQPKDKMTLENLPGPVGMLVAANNPALVMVLSQDPLDLLMQGITEVKKSDDVAIGDKKFTSVVLIGTDHDETLLIDPQTHLLRRLEMDKRKEIEKGGEQDVKTALVAFDYQSTTPAAPAPATQPGAKDAFAWSAPVGAKDVTQLLGGQDDDTPATELVGKPAPEFKLKSLEGKDVSLAGLKGKVVVIDFWATWCGPCQESMPHLNKLYKENKDNGFTLIGVNADQDKTAVAPFVKQMGLLFPVVLDGENGAVANNYKVNGFPTTFVIGKNGVVLKVIVGNSPKTAEELESQVARALQAPDKAAAGAR